MAAKNKTKVLATVPSRIATKAVSSRKYANELSSSDDSDVEEYNNSDLLNLEERKGSTSSNTTSDKDLASEKDQTQLPSNYCRRCLGPATSWYCRIPHAVRHRRDDGVVVKKSKLEHRFICLACKKKYSIVYKRVKGGGYEKIVRGTKWCFRGRHTRDPLPEDDLRRNVAGIVELIVGPSIQKDIDELPHTHPDAEILCILSDGFYEFKGRELSLEIKMSKLKKLSLVDVPLTNLRLNDLLTPNIEEIELKNIPDECDIDIMLSRLRNICIHFWNGPSKIINDMLKAAQALERFESYKLRVTKMSFASNALQTIDLHRADRLEELSIWAPRLKFLGLQACPSVRKIDMIQCHALRRRLPFDFRVNHDLLVQCKNSQISTEAFHALRSYPRVTFGGPEHPETLSESMLAQLT
mmetsp:Transcript_4151/g.5617  ORF Transcript_4151/g.5617 Transcript_4151/m.5617 type:complete len:411 (+) Transcript_4151:212-1444(+)|eukprot:jgi/Bigna1/91697/estExt_fgenesh1_pg.C_1140008